MLDISAIRLMCSVFLLIAGILDYRGDVYEMEQRAESAGKWYLTVFRIIFIGVIFLLVSVYAGWSFGLYTGLIVFAILFVLIAVIAFIFYVFDRDMSMKAVQYPGWVRNLLFVAGGIGLTLSIVDLGI